MKFLGLVLLFGLAQAKHEMYIGYKSYSLAPNSSEQLQGLGKLVLEYDIDVLSHPILGREGIVIVKPSMQEGFTKALEDLQIAYKIHNADLKAAFDHEDEVIETRKRMSKSNGRMAYDNYQELSVINAYLDDIANRYPDKVTLVSVNSFEGRPIKYLKISTTNFKDTSKPVIVIDGGIHAREWISPPTVTWAIKKLVEDVTEPDLLERFDWILLPVANPDGYEFSFKSTRLWRKTRSTDQTPSSFICPGVDGNRNYDHYFGTSGTSTNPCSDTFPGSKAFSEIETRVIRDILDEHLARIALYLTMHSYGSMILYPWGHEAVLSNNAFALQAVGNTMAQAIDALSLSHFPNYKVGNSVLVIGYPASGASEDYAHSVGVPLSYTYELPGLNWLNGFHLDPRYIEQVCIETWAGIAAGARRAGDLFTKK